jgi:DNA-directed RNA polymerase sigma subunit (sigma70/sigma32)
VAAHPDGSFATQIHGKFLVKNRTNEPLISERSPKMKRQIGTYLQGKTTLLREIMQTPLLTAQQEIELAARPKKGDQKARAWMIKANLRLVVKIAHDYSNLGLPLLDLISEGNLSLLLKRNRLLSAWLKMAGLLKTKRGILSCYTSRLHLLLS